MSIRRNPEHFVSSFREDLGKTPLGLAKLSASLVLALTLGLVSSADLSSPVLANAHLDQSNCTYQLGFKQLADQIPLVVGQCRDNESYSPSNGDALQHTDKGLLVWRKTDNFTAFTDGYRTWINGPSGIAARLNSQRFTWENDPTYPQIATSVPQITLSRINTDQKLIALTLDTGQGSYGTGDHMTEEQRSNIISMMRTIKQNNAKATFFGTGTLYEDEGNRQVMEAIIDGGNEFGNHTYNHKDAALMTIEEFLNQTKQTEAILNSKYGRSTFPWFRYPFLSSNYNSTLAQNGYYSVWMTDSCESGDWVAGSTSDTVVKKLTAPACMTNGAIILAHAYTPQTRDALGTVLQIYQRNGFEVTTLSQVWRNRN